MKQPSLFAPQSLSVSDINRYLRELMESDEILSDLWVQGEIATLEPASGHIYFTLKDANSTLRCVVWKSAAMRMQAALQSGAQIEAHGYIGLYEQGGHHVDAVRLTGEGALTRNFYASRRNLNPKGYLTPRATSAA